MRSVTRAQALLAVRQISWSDDKRWLVSIESSIDPAARFYQKPRSRLQKLKKIVAAKLELVLRQRTQTIDRLNDKLEQSRAQIRRLHNGCRGFHDPEPQ
jgi:exonuclease VII large subunit